MNMVMTSCCDGASAGADNVGRHSVRQVVRLPEVVRQSGRALSLALLVVAAASAQTRSLELDLRGGEHLVATSLTGSPEQGFTARVGDRDERLAPGKLLAVRVQTAVAPKLLRVDLVGGDVLHGAIAGGDADGDHLELLSPVLGKIRVLIDRLEAIVQPGVHPSDQRLPEGVDEALFVSTGRGFDLLAGTLHRFGSQGVSFQEDGVDDPRWYSPRRLSSLRLRGGMKPELPAAQTLLTRAADRVGLVLQSCGPEGLQVALESGQEIKVAWNDVACLCFNKDVVHVSSLQPKRVVESGVDSEVTHSWRRDRCVIGGELLAQGKAFGRGLGVHSRSRLTFVVPEGATHFMTRVAMDDSVAELPVRAHAEARVLLGNKLLFEAKQLQPGAAVRDAGMHAVKGGDTITLEVDFGRGRDIGDRVNWLLPMFLMRSRS